MLGDGPLLDATRELIRAYSLEDAVSTPGWVDDPSTWYGASKAFVLTSERDALPLTLIEAMANGTVPVVSAVGNVPDVVTDRNGIVVDPPSVGRYETAILQLLEDRERRDRKATEARRIEDRFSYDAAADDWRYVCRVLSRSDRT